MPCAVLSRRERERALTSRAVSSSLIGYGAPSASARNFAFILREGMSVAPRAEAASRGETSLELEG